MYRRVRITGWKVRTLKFPSTPASWYSCQSNFVAHTRHSDVDWA